MVFKEFLGKHILMHARNKLQCRCSDTNNDMHKTVVINIKIQYNMNEDLKKSAWRVIATDSSPLPTAALSCCPADNASTHLSTSGQTIFHIIRQMHAHAHNWWKLFNMSMYNKNIIHSEYWRNWYNTKIWWCMRDKIHNWQSIKMHCFRRTSEFEHSCNLATDNSKTENATMNGNFRTWICTYWCVTWAGSLLPWWSAVAHPHLRYNSSVPQTHHWGQTIRDWWTFGDAISTGHICQSPLSFAGCRTGGLPNPLIPLPRTEVPSVVETFEMRRWRGG